MPLSFLSSLRSPLLYRSPLVRQSFLALGVLASWTPMLIFFNDHAAQIMWVTGPSMYPLLNTDYNSTTQRDVCIVSMWAPWKDMKRGMVVAFRSPYNPEHVAVKRVIALPGDEVITKPPYPVEKAIVPVGHVWVEGEHPDYRRTLDSNTYGPVAASLIVGRVKAVVWPRAKAGRIRWQDYRGNPRVLQEKHVFEEQYIPA